MIKTLSNTARRILDSLVIKNSVVKIPPGKTEAGVYGKNDGPVGGPDMAEHITKLRTAATTAREVLVECRAVLKLADEAPKAFDTAQANVTFARIHKALELLDALS